LPQVGATQPRNGVGGAQCGSQPFRHLLQQNIASSVSARIVDLLEPVNVKNHHAQQRLVASRALHGRFQPVANLLQYPAGDLFLSCRQSDAGEDPFRLVDRERRVLGDRETIDLDGERFGLKSRAFAGAAGHLRNDRFEK